MSSVSTLPPITRFQLPAETDASVAQNQSQSQLQQQPQSQALFAGMPNQLLPGLPPVLNQMSMPSLNDQLMAANNIALQSQQMLQAMSIRPENTIWGGMMPTLMEQVGINEQPPQMNEQMQQQMANINQLMTHMQSMQGQMSQGYMSQYGMGASIDFFQSMLNYQGYTA